MDNNQMKFDPMTGQPINTNINNNTVPPVAQPTPSVQQIQPATPIQPVPTTEQVQPTQTVTPVQPVPTVQPIEQISPVDNTVNTQQQIQNIPTVEQTKQEFIENTQANNTVKKEEKKEGPNITFIVILFVIIFAAIFFLFPYLMNILG